MRNVTIHIGWRYLGQFALGCDRFYNYTVPTVQFTWCHLQPCTDTLRQLKSFVVPVKMLLQFDVGCSFRSKRNKTAIRLGVAGCGKELKAFRNLGHRIVIRLLSSHTWGPKEEALASLEDWQEVLEQAIWPSEPKWDPMRLEPVGRERYSP